MVVDKIIMNAKGATNMMTKTERAEKKAANAASLARMNAAKEEARRVVASGKCPTCGAGLRENLSILGWWQCEQLGAEGFRKDASKPSCSWQGFTV